MNVLELTHLKGNYDGMTPVLDDVTLTVAPGEVVGLLGRNGAGKTTLMRLAIGMMRPRGGSVRLFGVDPAAEPVAARRRIGFVAESQELPPGDRIEQLAELHRALFPTWDDAFACTLFERFEIDPRATVRTMSRGQVRAAALVLAVAHRPELLLLDEPAAGLDPVSRREFLETAVELLGSGETALLFSTHQMGDIERLAARVALLDEGSIMLDAPLDALREGYSLVRARVDAARLDDYAARLGALPACVGVRKRRDRVAALLHLAPQDAREVVGAQFGPEAVTGPAAPLEELFVEMAGRQA